MRTKTLILSALLTAAASPLFAQTSVYSVNAVGYVQVALSSGKFQMVGNPLNATNNTIQALLQLPDANAGTTVYKWNGTGFTSSIYQGVADGWTIPNMTLNTGEGCFIKLAGPDYTTTFVGEVAQGNLTNNLPSGFAVRESIVPQAGDADTLGITASANPGDVIYRWNVATQSYQTSIYQGSPDGWSSPTTLAVAQSFFYKNVGAAHDWVRTFSVNN